MKKTSEKCNNDNTSSKNFKQFGTITPTTTGCKQTLRRVVGNDRYNYITKSKFRMTILNRLT